MIECVCINDKDKPKEIPLNDWIVLDEKYHITYIFYYPNQGIQGCSLYEKPLGKHCFPYESFKLSRFAIDIKDLESLIELIKNCTELNNLNIKELLKLSELEIIEQ